MRADHGELDHHEVQHPLSTSIPPGKASAWALSLSFLFVLSGCFDDGPAATSGRWWSDRAAILNDDAFDVLVVEIDVASEYQPSALALSALRETLTQYAKKDTITVLEPTRVPAFGATHSLADVLEYHVVTRDRGTREQPWSGSTFYIHVLYLDGQREETAVLGEYHGNGEITIMGDLMVSGLGPRYGELPGGIREDQVERKSLIHEFGHAFGLVNCGIPMIRPHEDPRLPCHSNNEHSVMSYWNWTTPQENVFRSVEELANIPWTFDEDDKRDMVAYKGYARTFSENYFEP